MSSKRSTAAIVSERGAKNGRDDLASWLYAEELLATMASIRRTARLIAARPIELTALTGSQIELVRLVRRRSGVSINQASDELGLAPNSVSTLVRQLVEAGMLVRKIDQTDRRVARLELTPGTLREVDAFRDRRVANLAAAMDLMTPAERRRLPKTLEAMNRLADLLSDLAAEKG